jgi:hypothetical protein
MDKDRKQQLVNLMSNYVDENNCIDISRFRTENPDEYALLPHYFGTVNNAVESNGWAAAARSSPPANCTAARGASALMARNGGDG